MNPNPIPKGCLEKWENSYSFVWSSLDLLLTTSDFYVSQAKFLDLLATVVAQLLSRLRLFATPWTAARQASLSFTSAWSLFKLMSIELVMPSHHLILCRPHLLLPSVSPSIWVFFQWAGSSHQVAKVYAELNDQHMERSPPHLFPYLSIGPFVHISPLFQKWKLQFLEPLKCSRVLTNILEVILFFFWKAHSMRPKLPSRRDF